MHPLNFAVPSADPLLPEHSSKLLTAVVNCVYINLDPWCGKREQNLLSHVLAALSAPSSILWVGNLLSLTTRLMVATIFLRKLLLSICGRTEVEYHWVAELLIRVTGNHGKAPWYPAESKRVDCHLVLLVK